MTLKIHYFFYFVFIKKDALKRHEKIFKIVGIVKESDPELFTGQVGSGSRSGSG
jgi:hypothetical protein